MKILRREGKSKEKSKVQSPKPKEKNYMSEPRMVRMEG